MNQSLLYGTQIYSFAAIPVICRLCYTVLKFDELLKPKGLSGLGSVDMFGVYLVSPFFV